MRYLTLAVALVVAEAVTGLDLTTLSRSPRINLLDSALHAPQASFGGRELHPELIDKAAVLAGQPDHEVRKADAALSQGRSS